MVLRDRAVRSHGFSGRASFNAHPHKAYNRIYQNDTWIPGQPSGQDSAHKEAVVTEAESRSAERNHERRSKPRIYVPFHATVRGKRIEGEEFNVETVLDNVSGEGLYMRMMPSVKEGTLLSIVLSLYTGSSPTPDAPRVVIEGVVLRVENKPGGVCGVAVAFDRVRFP